MSKHIDRPGSTMSADSLEVPPSKNDKYRKQVHIPADIVEHKKRNENPKDMKNYLILNRKPRKSKTYLEKFREKLGKNKEDENVDVISVEAMFGDSETGSVADDSNIEEFLETECYNEMVYHLLMNEGSPEGISVGNAVKTELPSMTSRAASYTSASVVSTSMISTVECLASTSCHATSVDSASTRRSARGRNRDYRQAQDKAKESGTRGAAREPSSSSFYGARSRVAGTGVVPVCRFGGLGPDMEALRPRLERARSVQRYSEQVRLDNKIRITRHKSLSDARTASTKTETNTNKNRIPVNEKSSTTVDKHKEKKRAEDTKPEGTNKKRYRNRNKLEKKEKEEKERKIRNNSSRGDNNEKLQLFGENIDLSYGFQLDGFRSCDLYTSRALRSLEERHRWYRDAVSDLYRDRKLSERPRPAADPRGHMPLP